MRINAYTLMEVTIAMLLTAIVLTVCLTAFNIIGSYYSTFHKQAESKDLALMLKHSLEQDFINSKIVIKEGPGIMLTSDSLQKHYLFVDSAVIRTVENLKADTFKCTISALALSFTNEDALDGDTIDHLSFQMLIDKKNKIQFEFDKRYSAYDLYK